jgi:HD-like signal output (HDOD) protein
MLTNDQQRPLPSSLALKGRPLDLNEERGLQELFGRSEQFAKDALPPISPLAPRLFDVDGGAPNAARELTEIIESDPVLTARILGIANSAAFAGAGKPILAVRAALLRLGHEAAFEAAFSQLMALWLCHVSRLPDSDQLRALWLEYLITGYCAREIAKVLDDDEIDPPLAYAAGLLHDVGTLALCHVQPRLMSRFMQTGYGIGTPLHDKFVEGHTRLGAALLHHWQTPPTLAQAAARHHAGFKPSEAVTTIVVCLADHLHEAVIGHAQSRLHPPDGFSLGCYGGATEQVSAALLALGLANEIDGIAARVAAESERIEALSAAVSG